MFYLLCVYLHLALFLGFHRHVYHLAHKWATMGAPRNSREEVAWYIQKHLFTRGYHQCPSCCWATKKLDEHVEVVGSYCWEDQQPKCPTCNDYLNGAAECSYCTKAAYERAAWEQEEARQKAEKDEWRRQYDEEESCRERKEAEKRMEPYFAAKAREMNRTTFSYGGVFHSGPSCGW